MARSEVPNPGRSDDLRVLRSKVRFHAALNAHDIDAVAAAITDDCIFEDTAPPDGTRHTGRQAVLQAFTQFLTDSPTATFIVEDMFIADDRALVQWQYTWSDGHVRGADVVRVADGRIAETLAYVKG